MINWLSVKKAADPIWRPAFNVVPPANRWQVRPMGGYHKISKGDNLAVIANRYGVNQQRLAAANPAVSPTALRIGQRINIPVNDQVYLKATKRFDPESYTPMPAMWRKALMQQESAGGKYLRNVHSSALGPYQMLRDRFLITQRNHPEMKGWKHEDLLTDRKKADMAFDFAMRDIARRFHYKYGRAMTPEEMVRSWHQPEAHMNAAATNYLNKIKVHYNNFLKKQNDAQRNPQSLSNGLQASR